MTDKKTEALKLALEALKKCHYYMIDAGLPNQSLLNEAFTAITAIRVALASKSEALMSVPDGAQSRSDEEQPAQQQEPVATIPFCRVEDVYNNDSLLTQLGVKRGDNLYTSPPAGARAFPKPAQQQEPVAVTYKEVWGAMNALYAGDIKQVQIALEMENKKLYTSPPASKPWVGLTKEEILEINDTVREQQGWLAFVRAIEAKLREKNA